MERRGIAAKVLVFIMGAAGVVLAVFVVAPWLEAPDQSPSRDAVVKGALASFGEAAGVMAAPSPLLPVGAENPVPGPVMDAPAVVPGNPDAAAAQDTGLPEVLSPQEAAVEAERSVEPMPAAPEATAPYEAVEEMEPAPAETVEAGKEAPPAPAVSELVEAEEPARSETETVPQWVMPEEPDGARAVEIPLEARYPPDTAEATAAPPVEPRSEFSPRPFVRSVPPPAEILDPSAGPAEAARDAGPARVPPPSDPVVVPGILRGVMGYRMPLVSRQALPDQVVSGVLIPAHTTYVILQPGYWELVGLSPDEVKGLRAAAEKTKADEPATRSEPLARGWNPFRVFRKNRTPAKGE